MGGKMQGQFFIDEGCEDYAGAFGGHVGSHTFVVPVGKTPRRSWWDIPLWCGYPDDEGMGPDHLLPAEMKAWEQDLAWELRRAETQGYPDKVYYSKWDYIEGIRMIIPESE
jgi:hypothetical protein